MDPGYGYPTAGPLYGYVPVQKTNGLAVASLVCSLVWLGGLGSILAIVFGFMARSQIKRSEGNVQGNGLAVAGIIIGFVGLVAVIFVTIARDRPGPSLRSDRELHHQHLQLRQLGASPGPVSRSVCVAVLDGGVAQATPLSLALVVSGDGAQGSSAMGGGMMATSAKSS